MSINEIQNQIIEEFDAFPDWLDKYEYLIDLAKDLPPIDAKYKTNEYLIQGCQSRVWIYAEQKDGLVTFQADTDALITKGIIALLVRVLSNQPASEILATDLFFIEKIGLRENLSPTRSNGLLAMVKQMRLFALAFQSLQNK